MVALTVFSYIFNSLYLLFCVNGVFFFGCLSKCTSIIPREQKNTLNWTCSDQAPWRLFFFFLLSSKYYFIPTSANIPQLIVFDYKCVCINKNYEIMFHFWKVLFFLFSVCIHSRTNFFRSSTFITDFDFFNLKIACVMIFISISFSALAIIAFIKRHKWSKPAKWITQQQK